MLVSPQTAFAQPSEIDADNSSSATASPPGQKKASLVALIGFALLAIDLALVGLAFWERFATIQYLSLRGLCQHSRRTS